jgi:flagellar basal body P-ring formation protein FlgA
MSAMKIARTVLVAIALAAPGLFAAGPAGAAPILKARIEVNTRVVTAGDMFTNAGELAAEPLFLAPAPGTTGEVLLADVRRAVARLGLTSFDAAGLSSIFVARSGLAVDLAYLNTLIAKELQSRRLIDDTQAIELSLANPLPTLFADTAAIEPTRLDAFQYAPGSARFSARLIIAGQSAPIQLSGIADRLVDVPVLTAALARGDLISASDYIFTPVPARLAPGAAPLTDAGLIGKTVRRSMGAGTTLRAIDVELPRLVRRNQTVTLYYRSGPLFLTVKGRAMADATLNEPVDVLSSGSKKIIRGIAVSPGAVLVGSGPQTAPMQVSAIN